MGVVSGQYSKAEIIKKYQKHVSNYEKIICDLKPFIQSSYAKSKKISCFLQYHFEFCNDAINVLQDAINDIENGTVNEMICVRLEKLFKQCVKEHTNLEDTYDRVDYEQSESYFEYYDIHIRLREECDNMGYCDDTVIFVRGMIANNVYTNNYYGDLVNTMIQQGTNESSQEQIVQTTNINKYSVSSVIIKKETTIKEIFINKMVDMVISCVFIILMSILIVFGKSKIYSSFNPAVQLFMLVGFWMIFIISIANMLVGIMDFGKVFSLKQEGKFVELQSKKSLLFVIFSDNNESLRCVGRIYKNIKGKIYAIKYKECPYCKQEPIGRMYLIKDIVNQKYLWRCSEQPAHKTEFDYKQEF